METSSEEEEEEEEALGECDTSDSGDLRDDYSGSGASSEELEIERESRKLDRRRARDQRLEREEMREGEREIFHLPTPEELDSEEGAELAEVQHRIREVVHVLCNFAELREPGRWRPEYLQVLKQDLMAYYGVQRFPSDKDDAAVSSVRAGGCAGSLRGGETGHNQDKHAQNPQEDVAQALIARG